MAQLAPCGCPVEEGMGSHEGTLIPFRMVGHSDECRERQADEHEMAELAEELAYEREQATAARMRALAEVLTDDDVEALVAMARAPKRSKKQKEDEHGEGQSPEREDHEADGLGTEPVRL